MSMRAAVWGSVSGLAVSVSLATAAVAEPLAIEDALARARAHNFTLRAATAELEAARGRLLQAGLIPANPIIAGDLARHTAPPVAASVDRGVSVAQEMEVGGQRGLRTDAAKHDVSRAECAFTDRQRTVEAEVRHAFAGAVAAERRRLLAADSEALAQRLAEAARRRARAGDVGELEVQLAQIESTRASQALAAADTERTRAIARVAAAIGAEPEETISIADQDDRGAPIAVPPEDQLVARALADRPDLATARAERAQLESEAELTHRRGWIPNPTVRGFYRHERENEEIVGGEVSVPLPVWNREQGTEAALHAAARRASAEIDRIVQQVPREIHLALVRRSAAANAWVRYQRDAMSAANAARDLIERAYAGGYLGLPEVLVQQDRLIQVRASAITAWLDLREAEADLIEAVGGALP